MPDEPATPQPRLLQSIPGRLLVVSATLLFVVLIVQTVIELPAALLLLRKVAALALIVAAGWVTLLVAVRSRRRFLWRVRRKLLLSYVFLSVVPVVLVLVFALAGGVVLYANLGAYLFRQGLEDVVADTQTIARNIATDVNRSPSNAQSAVTSRYSNWSTDYPEQSLAIVPAGGGEATVAAGSWGHGPAPASIPRWVVDARGFTGVVSREEIAGGDPGRWIVRSAVPTGDRRHMVIVDMPFAPSLVARLGERTGARILDLVSSDADSVNANFFRQETVALVEARAWSSGQPEQVTIRLAASVLQLFRRISAEAAQQNLNRNFMWLLVLLAVLFAIIQGSAMVMGGALARSITYAVHELFIGTERVREGDFTHRIRVDSEDQLGDLAASFNKMSGSMEHLLHVQREKQRLDDELRIARDIQKSLLPVRPPAIPGMRIADLCEPAREVGGDYYDFFDLGPGRLGVLIADVSGKGTSAALYMAELKGLMLALSHLGLSPKHLLRTVNHLLAEHFDNRSFITAAYAVIDLNLMTMTCVRAGHTPLIVVSGGRSELLIPDGMVLGLRLPGASERFESLLEEHTRPLFPGDLIVLYTDGITEAMDVDGELFGDAGLSRVLASVADLDPSAIRERVVREVKSFVGEAEPHDDMTMVAIRIDGIPAAHAA